MFIAPVNNINNINPAAKKLVFGHGHKNNSNYSSGQKAIITGMSILGVLAGAAVAAKFKGYSLKPSKMFSNIKNSYFLKSDFKAEEVVTMGAGSILGGLAAGYIVDKDTHNRRAKKREALMQIGNVAIPIFTVDLLVDKTLKNSSKWAKAIGGASGIVIGVTLANIIMNKVNNWIFNENNARNVKFTDYSVHLDDAVVAANYISKSKVVKAIGRLVPAALVIPGLEVGKKTVN